MTPANPLNLDWPDGTAPEAYDLEQARRFCADVRDRWAVADPIAVAVRASSHPAAAPLYAFARLANSFADDADYEGRRHDALTAWQHQLERAYHGEAWHPVFIALADVVRTHDIPITPLRDMLLSFQMDLAGRQPATFDALLQHCRLSAGSVGRLVMHVTGETDAFTLERADDLGVGLRLVDIIADLGQDLRRGRRYLPLEDMAAFDVESETLVSIPRSASVEELIHFQIARARAWLSRARPLLRSVSEENHGLVTMLCAQGEHRLQQIEQGRIDPLAPTH